MRKSRITDQFMDYGRTMLKGLLINNTPTIAKGMLNELLRLNNITPEIVIDLVNKNQSLWAMIPEDHFYKFKNLIAQIGDIEWITTEWLIEATRKDHSGLASLFLGWKKARNWLDRQVEELKVNLT